MSIREMSTADLLLSATLGLAHFHVSVSGYRILFSIRIQLFQ